MNKITLAALTTGVAFSLTAWAGETITHSEMLEEYFANPTAAEPVETVDRNTSLMDFFASSETGTPVETYSRNDVLENLEPLNLVVDAGTVTRNDVLENLEPISLAAGYENDVQVVTRDVALVNYFEERDERLAAESIERLANPDNYQAVDDQSADDRINALVKYFKDQEKKQDLKRAQLQDKE